MADKILEISNVYKRFGDNNVLNGVNISVEKGEVIVILGPSGSGKTTMLRTINFLDPADAGQRISIDGMTVKCQEEKQKEGQGTTPENGDGISAVQPVQKQDSHRKCYGRPYRCKEGA